MASPTADVVTSPLTTANIELEIYDASGIQINNPEIAQLESQLKIARFKEDAMKQERDEWFGRYQNEQAEVFRLASASGKQNRTIQALEDEKRRLRSENETQEQRVSEVEAKYANLKAQTKQLTRDAERRAAAGQSLASLSRPRAESQSPDSEVKKLQSQIEDLRSDNAHLVTLHEESGCEEYCSLVQQQLADTRALLVAAECELEGFQHMDAENKTLREQHLADTARIAEAIMAQSRLEAKANTIEGSVDSLSEESVAAQSQILTLKEELESYSKFYNSDSDEICEDKGRVVLSPRSQPGPETIFLTSDINPRLTAPVTSDRSDVDVLGPTAVLSDVQVRRNSDPFSNPELIAKIQELGKSVMELTTLPVPTIKVQLPKIRDTAQLDVAVTINIKPSDKKNWALLQRVQSAISKTSPLDIVGPPELVKSFVAGMEKAEADHTEKTTAAAQWQKVALANLTEADRLRKELTGRPKCVDAAHRYLKDELEAKEVQYTMQEAMMAEWRKAGREAKR